MWQKKNIKSLLETMQKAQEYGLEFNESWCFELGICLCHAHLLCSLITQYWDQLLCIDKINLMKFRILMSMQKRVLKSKRVSDEKV